MRKPMAKGESKSRCLFFCKLMIFLSELGLSRRFTICARNFLYECVMKSKWEESGEMKSYEGNEVYLD